MKINLPHIPEGNHPQLIGRSKYIYLNCVIIYLKMYIPLKTRIYIGMSLLLEYIQFSYLHMQSYLWMKGIQQEYYFILSSWVGEAGE